MPTPFFDAIRRHAAAAPDRPSLTVGATTLSVNLPQLVAGASPGLHRFAHLHRNVPGVLATVNSIAAFVTARHPFAPRVTHTSCNCG